MRSRCLQNCFIVLIWGNSCWFHVVIFLLIFAEIITCEINVEFDNLSFEYNLAYAYFVLYETNSVDLPVINPVSKLLEALAHITVQDMFKLVY